MGKLGGQLYEYANGLDTDPVRSRYEAEPVKSVGNGTTFPQNLTTRTQIQTGIAMLPIPWPPGCAIWDCMPAAFR